MSEELRRSGLMRLQRA